MTLRNCGVAEHHEDCLCDVIIPHPTGWVNDAIQDMWMGPDILRMLSYPSDMTDENIISYLENLVYAKDNWNLYDNDYDPDNEPNDNDNILEATRKEIRRRLQDGHTTSLRTVADELELDLDQLNHVLFQSIRYMTWEQFQKFEHDVINKDYPSVTALAKRHDMSFRSAMRLHAYWRTPAYKTRRRGTRTVGANK